MSGGMFDKLSQLMNLTKLAPKIQEESQRFQQRVGQLVADGDAGGGMVKVRVNGRMEVQSCNLSDDALKLNDREVLEDLIRAAANQALQKARQQVAEEAGKMMSDLGLPAGMLPPGMGLPGLG